MSWSRCNDGYYSVVVSVVVVWLGKYKSWTVQIGFRELEKYFRTNMLKKKVSYKCDQSIFRVGYQNKEKTQSLPSG